MAITVGNNTSASGATVTKPTGAATGDTVVVAVSTSAAGAGIAIPGFTNHVELPGFAYSVALLTRVLDGSEGATWTASSGALIFGNGALVLTPGAGNVLALDGTPTSNSAGNGSTATVPAITTAVANTILIAGFTSSASGHTTPAGMTEVFDIAGVGSVGLSLDYEAIAAAGSTGTRASTTGGIRMVGVMLALKEVPASVNHPLAGTSSGTGDSSAALKVTRKLLGASAGIGAQTGTLRLRNALVGTSAGIGAQTGLLRLSNKIAGTSSGIGNATAALSVAGSTLVGTSAGVGNQTGALSVAIKLAATSAGVGAQTGSLDVVTRIAGTSAGIGNQTGALRVVSPIAATSAGIGDQTGALGVLLLIAGVSTGTGDQTGTLSVRVAAVITNLDPPLIMAVAQGESYLQADGRALTWTDATWPSLQDASVTVTVSPGFAQTVFPATTVNGDTVSLDLSAEQTAAFDGDRVYPYEVRAEFDRLRTRVLAVGLVAFVPPGGVLDGNAIRNEVSVEQGQAYMRSTGTALTWTDLDWPVLDDVNVSVILSPGFSQTVFDAITVDDATVSLDLSASNTAALDVGAYPYELRADFDATGTEPLVTGLLTVDAA